MKFDKALFDELFPHHAFMARVGRLGPDLSAITAALPDLAALGRLAAPFMPALPEPPPYVGPPPRATAEPVVINITITTAP
jgi:hypothetical protein